MTRRVVLVALAVAVWAVTTLPAQAAPRFEATFAGAGVPTPYEGSHLVQAWRFDGLAVTTSVEQVTGQVGWSHWGGGKPWHDVWVNLQHSAGGALEAALTIDATRDGDPSTASEQPAGFDVNMLIWRADGRFAGLQGQRLLVNLRTTPWEDVPYLSNGTVERDILTAMDANGVPGRAMVATLSVP